MSNKENNKPVQITELVLRDGHQSLFATRMRIDDMLPIAEKLDKIGYWSMESWGGATFDACIRFLGEDPWERIREIKKVMPNTPQQMLLRAQNLLGYRQSMISLMQMAKTAAALEKLKEAKIPYISIMVDPIYGGVSASLAMLGDINIAEPKALVGFAGRRVIEQTVRVDLPEDFQKSEFLLEHGAIDMITHRRDLRQKVSSILSKLYPLK